MTLIWRPRYISMLNMVPYCICLYMYIIYFHFCWAFVIFAVISLCFSVDTIFSAYWLKLRVLFVQLKMLWSQTQDNGHAGLVWNALSCVGVVLAGYFGVAPARGAREINILATLKSYNSGVLVQIQSWTDQQVSRNKNKQYAIIQNELSLMSFYFFACKFQNDSGSWCFI